LSIGTTVLSRHSLGPKWRDAAPIDKVAAEAWADGGPSLTLYRRQGESASGDGSFLLRHSYLVSYLNYKVALRLLRHRMEQQDLKNWGPHRMDDKAGAPEDSRAQAQNAYLAQGLGRVAALARDLKFRIIVVNIDPALDPKVPLAELPPGTQVFDFAPDLRAEATHRWLRFKYDPHYNPGTNRLLGELLAKKLKEHLPGLIPAS
jgi:hypothetical protein